MFLFPSNSRPGQKSPCAPDQFCIRYHKKTKTKTAVFPLPILRALHHTTVHRKASHSGVIFLAAHAAVCSIGSLVPTSALGSIVHHCSLDYILMTIFDPTTFITFTHHQLNRPLTQYKLVFLLTNVHPSLYGMFAGMLCTSTHHTQVLLYTIHRRGMRGVEPIINKDQR